MTLNISADWSQLADFTGKAEALADTIDSGIYIDDLLRISHARTTKQFDQEFAATAVATQKFNHMFEWGTAGINPAPGTPPLKPTSAKAKLWSHKLGGRTTSTKSIEFDFRASMVPVPLPTPRRTGISGSLLSGNKAPRRRHFFYWKAPVMEFGMTVTIRPVYAEALWIPLHGNPRTENTRAIKNNFIMTNNAVESVPGEHFAGNFIGYWQLWWRSEGFVSIRQQADAAVTSDSHKVVGRAGKRKARKYVAPRAKSFSLQVSTARAEGKAELLRESKRRRLEAAALEQPNDGGKWSR